MLTESSLLPNASIPIFGYFCVEDSRGFERILINCPQGEKSWSFSFQKEYNPLLGPPEEVLNNVVSEFVEHGIVQKDDLRTSGLAPFLIKSVKIPPSLGTAIFCKIPMQREIVFASDELRWIDKSSQFSKFRTDCTSPDLIDSIFEEWVYYQAGLKILECVDMIVFRMVGADVQFLMLKREDRLLSVVGWEYPKGPTFFHETPREAAARELHEETHLDITNYTFRGDLGYQTVNVAWRKKPYDTLHLNCTTYLFTGKEEEIVPYKKEGLRQFTWMTWEEAKAKVWMKDYGPEFFDRWKEHESDILRGL